MHTSCVINLAPWELVLSTNCDYFENRLLTNDYLKKRLWKLRVYIYIYLLITIWLGESTSIWIQLYQLWLRAVHDVRSGRSGRLGALPGGIFWHENLWGQWPKPKHSKTETRNMVFFPAYGKYGCSGGGQRMAKVLWQTQPEVGDATSKTTHLSKQTTVSKMKVLETTFLWVQKSKTQKQQMHNNRFEKQ